MAARVRALLFAFAALTAAPLNAERLTARVDDVLNADLLLVSVGKSTLTVRLWGIAPPPWPSADAEAARQHLVNRALRATVLLDVNRAVVPHAAVATLTDGRNLAVDLVRRGLATWDRGEAPGDEALAEAERHAREKSAGLWGRKPEPIHAPEPSPPPPEPDAGAPAELINAVLRDAAAREKTTADKLRYKVVPARWPDASLGCPQPGQVYAQAVTPGYIILVQQGERLYFYNCDGRAEFVMCKVEPFRGDKHKTDVERWGP